ncbi:MAG TPA: divalent-cation tolerance protein CutA [Nitrospira sp.]|nr:divalent-cation tolerance protein CutA [Nitrospira sp.]
MRNRSTKNVIIVFTAVPKRSDALKLSRALVKKRVAACANILPGIRSFYWWEGRIQEEREVLVMLKSTKRRYSALEKAIKASHPYKVPEILGVSAERGLARYIAWVENETTNV